MGVIDDIKQKLDIVQVVSEYVSLQKSGRNFKALCPFHTENHPSFFVFPERQSWHCFGACGTGGDVFSFIMKKEGLDFGQALRLSAERAGVNLVASSSAQTKAEAEETDRLLRMNEAAAEYYHHLLLNSLAGEMARDYVARRGLSPQTIANYQLGFSPAGWEALRQYLMGNGYAESEMLSAGLLVERDGGGSYDRFRNRLMFPIRDIQGNVLGFGARALDESLPKYINSPQTPIFDKSSSLYGIDRAKRAIRRDNLAIITEGYMDVLTAHQHGWENTVASMGTSVTDTQLAIAKKLSKNLMLALDADAAGEEAVSRSGETIDKVFPVVASTRGYGWRTYDDVSHDLEVKVFVLPPGKDPDEVIRKDASQWQELIANAKPIIDFILDTTIAKVDLESAGDKSSVVEKLLPLLSEMRDPVRQAHYVERLGHLLKTDERAVGDALRKFQAIERRKASRNLQTSTSVTATSLSSSPVEEYCLALLLQFSELRSEGLRLSPDYFERSENRELFLQWQQSDDLVSLRNSLDSTLHGYLDSLLAKVFLSTLKESELVRRQTLNDCTVRLQEIFLRNLEAKKVELLAIEAETGGVTAELAKLDQQGIEISRQLREVFVKQAHRRQPALRRSEE